MHKSDFEETILTRAEITRRLARHDQGVIGRDAKRSDFDLNPHLYAEKQNSPALKRAAVLAAIVEREGGFHMVLTRRTQALSTHAGQVAFPGGRLDEGEDPQSAALREAEEEVGIKPRHVEIIGQLDQYHTVTGYHITPYVGFIDAHCALVPNPAEVEEIFEVPLSFLLNPDNHQRHQREWGGQIRYFYAMPYESYYIWGATAAMLVNLTDVILNTNSGTR